MMERLNGIIILSAVHVALAAFLIAMVFGIASGIGTLGRIFGTAGVRSPAPLADWGGATVFALFLAAAGSAVLAWGLWTLRPWARTAALATYVFVFLTMLSGVVVAISSRDGLAALLQLLVLSGAGAAAWHLLEPDIKHAFAPITSH
jgi:hypothetical protein